LEAAPEPAPTATAAGSTRYKVQDRPLEALDHVPGVVGLLVRSAAPRLERAPPLAIEEQLLGGAEPFLVGSDDDAAVFDLAEKGGPSWATKVFPFMKPSRRTSGFASYPTG